MGATERGMCREERETMYLRGGGGVCMKKINSEKGRETMCLKRGGGVYEKINSEMECKNASADGYL